MQFFSSERTSYEGGAGYGFKPATQGLCLEVIKFFRRDITPYRVMLFGGSQVLPHGQELATGGPEIIHNMEDFPLGFTQTQHDTGFGDKGFFMGPGYEIQGSLVNGLGPHFRIQPGYGFDVVI
jgi:hypothetical protein